MCIRNRAQDLGSASNTNNSVIKHPIRKIRTKTRRPKFLSLLLELTPPRNSTPMSPRPKPPALQEQQQQQLTLFPLHPENMVEDRDSMHDENVALMFNSDVVSSCCSLQSLSFLPSYQNDMSSTEEESRNLVGGREAEGGSWLVRAAMRSREREAAEEEKWVCYSEVVEKKEEEVTSTAADEWVEKKYINKKKNKMEIIGKQKQKQKQLRLKLDYEGILNAWSDKAPLYINGESPQTVPNLHDDQIFSSDSLPNRCCGMGSEGNSNNNNNNVWKVPEMEGWKMGQREASVLRYKEKRQSRLFSKRIRYQVRKLNAEKRPRMKGRFVKRS